MGEDRYLRDVIRLLWAGLMLAAVWLAVGWALPLLAPFLLGGALACLVEPLVKFLTGAWHMPRRVASALCVLSCAALAGGGAALIVWRLWYELTLLASRLPHLLEELGPLIERVEEWLYRVEVALPTEWKEPARQAVEELLEGVLSLPVQAGEWAVKGAAGILAGLPSGGLFLFTAFLAAYFFSTGKPGLRLALKQLPAAWQDRLKRWRRVAARTLLNWLRVQGVLLMTTFAQLTLGMLLLGVEPAILLAGLIALVDALPIFGSGAVLLPWSLVALLQGDFMLGIGLIVLYAIVTLVRSVLEPRLVRAQAGLPPLVTLLSMYIGFKIFGVAGIILTPVIVVIAWQLWLGREDEHKKGADSKPPLRTNMPNHHC